MNVLKKALLVEFGTSHTELFYTHIRILKDSGYQLYGFFNEQLKGRFQESEFTEVQFFNEKQLSIRKQAKTALEICKKNHIQLIIDNSAHSNQLKWLALRTLFNSKIQIVGVCHYLQKLTKSLSQRIISLKVKKYFILSDLLRESTQIPSHVQIKTLYPIFFPKIQENRHIDKKQDVLWIGICGSVLFSRRDYHYFLEALRIGGDAFQKMNIQFVLLGSMETEDGQTLLQEVRNQGLEASMIFFQGFIDEATYEAYLEKMDALLTLVHPHLPEHAEYLNNKISGTYNLAFAWKKPLILEKKFAKYKEFQGLSFYYDAKSPRSFVEAITKFISEKETITTQTTLFFQKNIKYSFEYQKSQYIDLIEKY
ncbi:MAG: hypothetical protein MUC49_06155 [Raineya sp.]|jgi:hypothetical protein|nr:hypothetical protein [Raineya sp.]